MTDEESPPFPQINYSAFTQMFKDGEREIHMVLCYEDEENDEVKREKRNAFENSLTEVGLELEKESSDKDNICFVKIHLPPEIEQIFGEDYSINPLIEKFENYQKGDEDDDLECYQHLIKCFCCCMLSVWDFLISFFEVTSSENQPSFYKQIRFHGLNQPLVRKLPADHLTSAQKISIVYQLLLRSRYDDGKRIGIENLINDGVYKACFPLHEEIASNHEVKNDRNILHSEWSSFGKWYKRQPLWLVRKYFGEKIALYFCWLGFYTNMLILPAIVGLLCFLYGILTMDSANNIPSRDICDIRRLGNTTLCPLCNNACSYLKLSNSCLYSKISYVFDNPATVFFAVFMSFWATTFLEFWKRKQAVIVWEWNLKGAEKAEATLPDYDATVHTYRKNPVTGTKEPHLRFMSKLSRTILSGSSVLTMMFCIVAVFLGVISYRLSVLSVIYSKSNETMRGQAKLITSLTASIINFVIMMIFTKIYTKVSLWLTNFEKPRTQTEFENSYAFKIFLLQFINFYGSLIYIAFFKGKFFTQPGDGGFLNLRSDICDPSGCFVELCIQLSTIMIGKQIMNNIREYNIPGKIYNWCKGKCVEDENTDELPPWERDYKLQDLGRLPLFEEYKEMVIQYGFVTLFVVCFPLGPLFALLNNIIETRLDAKKMVLLARRPIASRAENIGVWYKILVIISQIAVLTNALLIAFTSEFIPRMVYKFYYSADNSLEGYVEDSLLGFNTHQYKHLWGQHGDSDPEICYYNGYRKPNYTIQSLDQNVDHWHILFARLTFVIIFEHLVFLLKSITKYIIPDVPGQLKVQMEYEQLAATTNMNPESENVSEAEKMD